MSAIDYDAIIAEAQKPAAPAVTAAAPAPREYIGDGKLSELEIAEQVADLLPTHHADAYDDWLEVLMAFHSVDSGSAGLEIAKRFSMRCPAKYNEAEIERKWAGFNPNGGKTIATLIKHVKDAGGRIQHYRKQATRVAHGQQNADAEEECTRVHKPRRVSVTDLLAFKPETDESQLLGDRFLCRGGSLGIVGQTGLGKSSFAMQAAVSWALGADVFGIKPVRALKSVIIQGENDDGDLAEAMQGVVRGLNLTERAGELDGQLTIYTEASRTARDFAALARLLILEHKPDLFIIDPWFSYLGGSVNDQAIVTPFLRNMLTPLSLELGTAFIIVHHTGKPPKDAAQRNGWTGGDHAYSGTGSAEFANWCRGMLTIKEKSEGLYELRAAKRGKRAGMTDENGEQTTTALLEHGKGGIYWQRATDESAAAENAIVSGEVAAVLDVMRGPSPSGKGWRYTDVLKAIKDVQRQSIPTAKRFLANHLSKHLLHGAGLYSVKLGSLVHVGSK